MNQISSQSKIHPRPKSSLRHKSPLPNSHPQVTRNPNPPSNPTQKSHKSLRPRSKTQSYDFNLTSSKMFHQPDLTKSKFCASAIPSPTFDIHICKEEISRLESQVSHSELLQNRLMRNEWRTAQKSIDTQFTINQKSYLEYNKKLEKTFKTDKEYKENEEKLKERLRKEEEFYAYKAVKLAQEHEGKKRTYDDLLREKTRFLHNQENKENKKTLIRELSSDKRNSFQEFVQASKEIENNEKIRERKEREFEYAQNLGAKWLRLKHKDQELQTNLLILNNLIN